MKKTSPKTSAFSLQLLAFSRGFTLIELLVVISIIAILAGMVMPMFYSAKERAREAKAKIAVKALETAFKSYLDTYKVWPSAWVAGTMAPIDGQIFRALRGDNLPIENKDAIAFFEFESYTNSAGMDPTTAWDPWSNPSDPATWDRYYVAFDNDYDNKITLGGQDIYRSVVVWSVGKDRQQDYGGGDDVASWK